DYNFGILQSSLHWLWFTEKGSTLKSDYRYTSNTVFNTFPFPQSPTVEQIRAVADCSRAILAYRQKEQEKSQTGISLRQIYKLLEMPGKNELRELHTALDNAIISAYGFDPKGDMLAQLLSLNETIFHKEKAGESVLAPGIPPYYPNPQELISDYGIAPKG
ncbi:MAG: class I SAM-dependent DNA methyltransferase, partial [Phototrophicales bacterium]